MIRKIKILSDDLHVYFNENDEIFSNIWLRDHARDEENWDKRSSQRKTFTAALDFKLKIKKPEHAQQSLEVIDDFGSFKK